MTVAQKVARGPILFAVIFKTRHVGEYFCEKKLRGRGYFSWSKLAVKIGNLTCISMQRPFRGVIP